MFPALLIVGWSALWIAMRCRSGYNHLHYQEKAAALFVRLLFLFYPVITTLAFQAFACHEFAEGSWLIVDVALDCASDHYQYTVRTTAWLAVVLYPIGAISVSLLLLISARKAILHPEPDPTLSMPRRWLANGLKFLYREYKPEFYCAPPRRRPRAFARLRLRALTCARPCTLQLALRRWPRAICVKISQGGR